MIATKRGPRAVQRSMEFLRVKQLPRRSLAEYTPELSQALSEQLRKPGSNFLLRRPQTAMLLEAQENGGLFSMEGVGAGKSFASPLFGMLLKSERWVLLVPPAMKRELVSRVLPRLLKEINIHPLPYVVAYSELSLAKNSNLLERIAPDLIVADEAHNLKDKSSARTKRFLRYFKTNPQCRFVAMSGTMTRKSLRDFGHILTLTHKGLTAPITRQWGELEMWANALDPGVHPSEQIAPGAFRELCAANEPPRDAYRRRLLDTQGVVGGTSEGVDASLNFEAVRLELPQEINDALNNLRSLWVTPGGEYVSDPLDFSRKARELSQGFYYKWKWPGGVVDHEWLTARSEWRKAVADVTKQGREGLDSELLVRNAVQPERDIGRSETLRRAREAWQAWLPHKDKAPPPVEPVWISEFVVNYARAWARDNTGIVWFEHNAVCEKLSNEANVFGAGDEANQGILEAAESAGEFSVFASIHAHGTGKNLQKWGKMLFLCPPMAGAVWEQTVGRCHRPGQNADEVTVNFLLHTEELKNALKKALEQARYIEAVSGAKQKMILGSWLNVDSDIELG